MKEKTETEPRKEEGLTDHIEAFSETLLKLALTTAIEKAVNISSVVLNIILIYLVSVFVLLFVAAGAAWWLGDILNNRVAGFFIVAAAFLIVLIIIILLRKKNLYPFIRNLIVRKVYE